MDDKIFAELMESAGEALEHAKGKRELRTTMLPEPPKPMPAAEIRRLRERLQASQAVFAHYLNVSLKLVQAWEASRRTPQGASLLLLRVAENNPQSVLLGFRATARSSRPTNDNRKRPAKGAKKRRAAA